MDKTTNIFTNINKTIMKKRTHTYNAGDIVTFKFLTGDIFTGKITHQTYKQDGTADYRIKVEDKKGFTIYPCMTEARIIKRNKTAKQANKDFDNKYRDTLIKERDMARKKSKLDDAIRHRKNL